MGFSDPNTNIHNNKPSPPPSYLESVTQNHPIVSQSQITNHNASPGPTTTTNVTDDPNHNPNSPAIHPPNQPYQIPDVLPKLPQQPMNTMYFKQDQQGSSNMNASMVSTTTSDGMGTSSYMMMNSQHQQPPMPVQYPLMNQQPQPPILPQQPIQPQQKVVYPTLVNTPPMQPHQQPVLPQPMPPQRPYVQPMMMSQQPQQPMVHVQPIPQPIMVRPPTTTTTTYVSQVNYVPPQQPVIMHPPPPQPVMVSQVPLNKGRTVVTTTTTVTPNPVLMPQPPTVQIIHGKPPTMPPGAMGYSTYYPQHATPVSQTTIYVQQKKKKSSFDKFMFGE
ncbi:hypothetical protein FDP41_010997 [Naegleria fowleri]|uniref:Uncharacterized protein n=1 Tax=Naegleria fowleri TaxID=5763 RepID=A0A6A5CCM5_NAEFO|nr:uncharacterized protein FDP41_010997 [Naegleria fowleri]KAF0983019.1 hypothetical protein FDP41_010997 [Naegleria fowleri]CAG4716264.1 unnamed protein product [Naegleria fowleri]